MVEVQQHKQSHLIILQPNRSMTWKGNKKVLAAMLAGLSASKKHAISIQKLYVQCGLTAGNRVS